MLASLVEVSETFIEIAQTMRALPGVAAVEDQCLMRSEKRLDEETFRIGIGPGFRIEWYADGNFRDGRALSFSEVLSWHDEGLTVEASVRDNRREGDILLLDLPPRTGIAFDALATQLLAVARLLRDGREEILQRFFRDEPGVPHSEEE